MATSLASEPPGANPLLSKKHAAVAGKIFILGCGGIGQGLIPYVARCGAAFRVLRFDQQRLLVPWQDCCDASPLVCLPPPCAPPRLLVRHIDIAPSRIVVVTGDERGRDVAAEYGLVFVVQAIEPDNYKAVFSTGDTALSRGDVFINVSVGVSTVGTLGDGASSRACVPTQAAGPGSCRRSVIGSTGFVRSRACTGCHHRAVQRARRDVYRYSDRAVGGWIHRHVIVDRRPFELRAATGGGGLEAAAATGAP